MNSAVFTPATTARALLRRCLWQPRHRLTLYRPSSTISSSFPVPLPAATSTCIPPRLVQVHESFPRRFSAESATQPQPSRLGHHTCPSCRTQRIPVTCPLCPSCSRPLPLHPSTSYFELLVPADLNLQQLPTALDLYNLDLSAVKKHFLTIQRAIHPDKLVGQAPQVKDVADATSAKVNKALDVVGKDRVARGEYLLQLLGIPLTESDSNLEDGSSSSSPMTSPDLLMFIMETREQIQDAESLSDLDSVQQEVTVVMEGAIKDFESALTQLPNPLAPGYDASSVVGSGVEKEAKEAAARIRYFRNVLRAVEDRREELGQ